MDVESTEQYIIADYFGKSAFDEEVKTIINDTTSDMLVEFSTRLIGDSAEQLATPYNFLFMLRDVISNIEKDKEKQMFGKAYYTAKERQTGVVIKATVTYSRIYKWNQANLCVRWHYYKDTSYEYYELNEFLNSQ